MKKSILNLGKTLNKEQQQKINGGFSNDCPTLDFFCDSLEQCCDLYPYKDSFPHCMPQCNFGS